MDPALVVVLVVIAYCIGQHERTERTKKRNDVVKWRTDAWIAEVEASKERRRRFERAQRGR